MDSFLSQALAPSAFWETGSWNFLSTSVRSSCCFLEYHFPLDHVLGFTVASVTFYRSLQEAK